MAHGPSILQQMWDELDELTNALMDPSIKVDNDVWTSGRARGIAYTLTLFMQPHFKTDDEIIAEAVKRRAARLAGEEYETPGLGSRIYEPPPGDNKLAVRPAAPGLVTRKPKINVDAETWETIKTSVFPIEMLAQIYKISVAEVKAIQSS